MDMINKFIPTIADMCMGHRYLYYVLSMSIISDQEYDEMERAALINAPEDHPIRLVGSDTKSSYDEKYIKLAESWLKRDIVVEPPESIKQKPEWAIRDYE